MPSADTSTMSPNDGILSQAEIAFRCYAGKFLFTPEERSGERHLDLSEDCTKRRENESKDAEYAPFYAILEVKTATARLQCLEHAFATRYRRLKHGIRVELREARVWNACSFDRLMQARCAELEAKARGVLGSPIHGPDPVLPSAYDWRKQATSQWRRERHKLNADIKTVDTRWKPLPREDLLALYERQAGGRLRNPDDVHTSILADTYDALKALRGAGISPKEVVCLTAVLAYTCVPGWNTFYPQKRPARAGQAEEFDVSVKLKLLLARMKAVLKRRASITHR